MQKQKHTIGKTLTALTLLVGLGASPALAVEPGGAKIKGKATQTVTAGNVVNVAAGYKAKAGLSAAAVHGGSEVGGDLRQTVAAKNIVNVAAGYQTQACTGLATIGDNPACR